MRLGAVLVVADAFGSDQVVAGATPDVLVHRLTAIGLGDLPHPDRGFALTNRVRTEDGSPPAAGQAVGVRRIVTGVARFAARQRTGRPVNAEEDSLGSTPTRNMRERTAVIRYLEEAVLATR